MFGNTGPFSYSPRGFPLEDTPLQRRTFNRNDLREPSPQRDSMSRPSGRSIYMQRKEYSDLLNKKPDNFHYRVEHLFSWDLDGEELKTVDNCVTKLKRLDVKGCVWPQEMILEIQGGCLVLCEIETKEELEVVPLSYIQETKAVLDSCAYNSLLAMTVKERGKLFPRVLLFQCEESGAEVIKSDLDKIAQKGSTNMGVHRAQPYIRNQSPASEWGKMEQSTAWASSFQGHQNTEDLSPNRLEDVRLPPFYNQREATTPDLQDIESNFDVPLPPEMTDTERNTEILNHVIEDIEIFLEKVNTVVAAAPRNSSKSKKKMGMKKKSSKKNGAQKDGLPPHADCVSCLQKLKYAFNLLAQLDGVLVNTTAPEFVHIFFKCLGTIVSQYPVNLPASVVSPLLTESALAMLSEVVSPEERQLWKSLGDCWSIPRSRWPYDDVPPYIPEFYDGWQPPPISYSNSTGRRKSQRLPSGQSVGHMNGGEDFFSRGMPLQPDQPASRLSMRSSTQPTYMRVKFDFMARNNREVSVMKGEVVEVVEAFGSSDKVFKNSNQWRMVRNSRSEEGYVPQMVLEPLRSGIDMEEMSRSPRGLDMSSSAGDVRAWLEYKGFSKMTVSTFGVLSGQLLLKMTKAEMRAVCPEEGSKVFFHLQPFRSAIALASEPSGQYGRHY